MAKNTSKQKLANLIQMHEQMIIMCRSLYDDSDLTNFSIQLASASKQAVLDLKKKLKYLFDIDYDSKTATKEIIKEGSEVVVLVSHMDGMKGNKAIIKGYSIPAMLSDITMKAIRESFIGAGEYSSYPITVEKRYITAN